MPTIVRNEWWCRGERGGKFITARTIGQAVTAKTLALASSRWQANAACRKGMGMGAIRERFDEILMVARWQLTQNLLRQAPLGPHTGAKTDLPKHTPSTEWQPGWVERKGYEVREEQEGVTSNDKDGQGGRVALPTHTR